MLGPSLKRNVPQPLPSPLTFLARLVYVSNHFELIFFFIQIEVSAQNHFDILIFFIQYAGPLAFLKFLTNLII
jgi:hypothetical protein